MGTSLRNRIPHIRMAVVSVWVLGAAPNLVFRVLFLFVQLVAQCDHIPGLKAGT